MGTTAAAEVPAVQQPKEPPVVEVNNDCGPHSAEEVYSLIRREGVPEISAIQLLGSWKTESGGDFNQCQNRGDGGLAHGLNSWHPGRRRDMPLNLTEQVHWAIHTEMPRDCRSCYDQMMNATQVADARDAIERSTRWGQLGGRWYYADQFATIF